MSPLSAGAHKRSPGTGLTSGKLCIPPSLKSCMLTGVQTQCGTHRPVSGSKCLGGRHSQHGHGDTGGGDKGSGTVACVTGGSRAGAVPEEGAVWAIQGHVT